jgi:hypothetical protein
MTNKFLNIFLGSILFITCSMSQPVHSENLQEPKSVKEDVTNASTVELTYLNSNIFDQAVASNMKDRNRTIRVKFPDRFSLNTIPERIDNWLTEIVKHDGAVELEAFENSYSEDRSLSLVESLVKIGITIYTYAAKENIYKFSKYYNGKIIYEAETGEITEIVLLPREQNKN